MQPMLFQSHLIGKTNTFPEHHSNGVSLMLRHETFKRFCRRSSSLPPRDPVRSVWVADDKNAPKLGLQRAAHAIGSKSITTRQAMKEPLRTTARTLAFAASKMTPFSAYCCRKIYISFFRFFRVSLIHKPIGGCNPYRQIRSYRESLVFAMPVFTSCRNYNNPREYRLEGHVWWPLSLHMQIDEIRRLDGFPSIPTGK
jgi:hypothetical protein